MPSLLNIILIPLLPLLSFVWLGLSGRRQNHPMAGWLATAFMLVSLLLSIQTAFAYFSGAGMAGDSYRPMLVWDLEWLPFTATAEGLAIHTGILLDPISVMMLIVVTSISCMVHLFSLGYMKGEQRFGMYYAYLGLFTFSMLGLVLSSNIFQMYMFWELVGVSSFLLIGFYYQKPAAVAAAKKAFIVTRFADLGFLLGILVLSYYGGSMDFNQLIQSLTSPESNELQEAQRDSFMGLSALSWGLSLVFIGGASKSALFPLHIWLPDAMEGPTPVSALIHAATMVVAGVYLVARLFPVYALSAPDILQMIGWTGAISALIAALIACTQTDIKRVLAYSTMSQIGFMVLALGVSGYADGNNLGFTASMFHLSTHAVFKALLFLCAGAVIHYVHSNEMDQMGGLRKQMPITHISFLLACLAISGFPFLAGFFSKEEILLAAYTNYKPIFWIAIFTSALTAFYMFRLYFRIFWHKPYHAAHHDDHHGEGTWTMKWPLLILALGTVFAGYIPFSRFVSATGKPFHTSLHIEFSIAPVGLALLGIAAAYYLYGRQSARPEQMQKSLGFLYTSLKSKLFIDELYLFITRNIIFGILGKWAAWIDKHIVDGLMNGLADLIQWIAQKIRRVQSGRVQDYALYFLIAILGLLLCAKWFNQF
ncbi:MAG TPA: NADH-quinone oxidoreductase subunit L [Chitinophagaceae bacterium]|nr:NADH-quinone oxidoreductase subunit L [Chitinophagaceae bacterium]